MKSKKISAIVAGAVIASGVFIFTPSIISNATPIYKIKKQQTIENSGLQLQAVNLKTGKVVTKTKINKEGEAQSFAVTYSGNSASEIYNNDNLQPLNNQANFASPTNETLYNQMLNPNNRWNAEKEALNLHNGDIGNDCAYFVSSALREIGVNIPYSTANCWTLQGNLSNMGWQQHNDLSGLKPGDVCFAGTDGDAHTFIFMGWANKSQGIAWIADSQFNRYENNYHPRDTNSNYWCDPTEFYFTAPGGETTSNVDTAKLVKPGYEAYTVGTINVGELNVRSGPSTSNSIIGAYNLGDTIQIFSQNNGWDKINYNGQIGYVDAQYVNGNAPSNPNYIHGEKPVYTSPQYSQIGTGRVNQYTWAMNTSSWNNNHITNFDNGDKVIITGYNNGWYRVNYQKGSVWIPESRINTSLRGEQYSKIGQGIINNLYTNTQNVMASPNSGASSIGTLQNGTQITITGRQNGFYRINYMQTSGWIPVNGADNTANYKVTPLNKTGVIDFNGGSYTDAKGIPTWYGYETYTLNNGTKVKITGEHGDWYQIKIDGKTEWVVKDRVQLSQDYSVIGSGSVTFPSYGGSYIMSAPTWESTYIKILNDGTNVKIIGESGSWYKILMPNGHTGYILKNRLITSLNKNILGNGTVNMYTDINDGPSWNNNCINTLEVGTKVNIVGEKAGWYEIDYDNGTAWVLGNRLNTLLNCNKKVINEGIISFNGGPFTDVVSGPSWNDDFRGEINNGQAVQIVGEYGNWYEINFNAATAWVLKDRVIAKGTDATIDFNQLSYTSVMTGPSWDSNWVAYLDNGTKVTILNTRNGWTQIKYNGNNIAWVMSNRLN